VTQSDLFPPYQSHSVTSFAAAGQIKPHTPNLRERVLDCIRRSKGATDSEVCQAMGLDGSTVRPRRIELQRAGMVVDSGRKRLTNGGRLAVVWEAV
jgi:hypothetical protein